MDFKFCFDCMVICLPLVKTIKGLAPDFVSVGSLKGFACAYMQNYVLINKRTMTAFSMAGLFIEYQIRN